MVDKDEYAILAENLVKKYGELIAVNDVSLKIKKGEIFAFLGPNGAGKTTTVEILEGIRDKDSGKAYVLGYDIDKRKDLEKIKRKIGTLPQEFNTYENLTVTENLRFWSRMFVKNIPIEKLIELVGLEDKAKEKYKNLSGGLKRRLGIAIALVNDPELIFLDEPTTGLDPRARRETWGVIEGLQEQGKTIFLTSHYMEEAQVLADMVAIIHKGKIMDIGSPTQLIDKYGGNNKIIIRCNSQETRDQIHKVLFEFGPMENEEGDIVLAAKKDVSISKVIDLLEDNEIFYTDIITQRPTLEDVFLQLTGEKLHDRSQEMMA
ncbi:MAG: ATP-binding cassette domain-containing protein [Candidatus Heimdallarchaeota archaeon]|nr:ATP-binding cassette domain-containing protein [Candidatus Heimdallarchaeota archaeon]